MKKFVAMSLWMIFLSSSLTSLSLINVSAQTEPKVKVMRMRNIGRKHSVKCERVRTE
jgi:hypothetical protein